MNLLATRRGRAALLAVLYFAEGAPIGWIWWALPTRLRAAGAPVDEVTALTAALALPWAFKFVWAPLVDAIAGTRLGLRGVALLAQLGMAAALAPLLGGADLTAPSTFAPLLFAHALLAATQDVAVDGIAVRVLPESERGAANGWMQVGMLAGRGLFGGLALRAESWIGFEGVVAALIGAIVVTALTLVLGTRGATFSAPAAARFAERFADTARALLGALTARRTLAGLAFALLGGAAFEAVGGTAGSLLVDVGVAEGDVGLFFATAVIAAMAAGALAGGALADRTSRRAAAGAALLLVAATVVLVSVLVLTGAGGAALFAALSLVYLALGALTASSYALFMDLSDPRVGATHFSLFMGATNLCESWAVAAAGELAAAAPLGGPPRSYAWAWLLLAAASLLAFGPLRAATPPTRSDDNEENAAPSAPLRSRRS